jgi:hypothetical protein
VLGTLRRMRRVQLMALKRLLVQRFERERGGGRRRRRSSRSRSRRKWNNGSGFSEPNHTHRKAQEQGYAGAEKRGGRHRSRAVF